MNRDKKRGTTRGSNLETERLRVKISSLEEQNTHLKNRVKQSNNNLDTLIGQLKYKEKSFEDQRKVYEAEITLLKNKIQAQVINCGEWRAGVEGGLCFLSFFLIFGIFILALNDRSNRGFRKR